MNDKYRSFVTKDVCPIPDPEASVDYLRCISSISENVHLEDVSVEYTTRETTSKDKCSGDTFVAENETKETTEMGGSHGCHKDRRVDSDDEEKAPYPPPSSVKTVCIEESNKPTTPSRERKKNKTHGEKAGNSTKAKEREDRKERSRCDSDLEESSNATNNAETTRSKTWEQVNKPGNKEKLNKKSDGAATYSAKDSRNTPDKNITDEIPHDSENIGAAHLTKAIERCEIDRKHLKGGKSFSKNTVNVDVNEDQLSPLHYSTESIINVSENLDNLHDTNYQYPSITVSGLHHVTQTESQSELLSISPSENTPVNIQIRQCVQLELIKTTQDNQIQHDTKHIVYLPENPPNTEDKSTIPYLVPPPNDFQDKDQSNYNVENVESIVGRDIKYSAMGGKHTESVITEKEHVSRIENGSRIEGGRARDIGESMCKVKYTLLSNEGLGFDVSKDVKYHVDNGEKFQKRGQAGFVELVTEILPDPQDDEDTVLTLRSDFQSKSSSSRNEHVGVKGHLDDSLLLTKDSGLNELSAGNMYTPDNRNNTNVIKDCTIHTDMLQATRDTPADCVSTIEDNTSEILTEETDSETFDSLETILACPEIYEKTKHLSSADEASVIMEMQSDMRVQAGRRQNDYALNEEMPMSDNRREGTISPGDIMDNSREIDDNNINEFKEDSLLSHNENQPQTGAHGRTESNVISDQISQDGTQTLNSELLQEVDNVDNTGKPKRGSEIICDVIDAYNSEMTDTTLDQKNIDHSLFPSDVKIGTETYETVVGNITKSTQELIKSDEQLVLSLAEMDDRIPTVVAVGGDTYDMYETMPTSDVLPELVMDSLHALVTERQSITCTESDLDMSEHRDDISSDNMYADDEDDGVGEVLFSRTYTQAGSEVLVSCTLVNTGPQDADSDDFWGDTQGTDDVLNQIGISADSAFCAFVDARKQMQEIHHHLQNLREQMERLHDEMETATISPEPQEVLSSETDSKRGLTD